MLMKPTRLNSILTRRLLAGALPAFFALPLATQGVTFDVNDVSFLFPVPQTKAEADRLISAADPLADGQKRLLPEAIFKQVMTAAKVVTVETPSGRKTRIKGEPPAILTDAKLWKVAGIRVHPSALGTTPEAIGRFGEAPTVRLILQPVTATGDQAEMHDMAAHVVFNFTTNLTGKFVPDEKAFRAVVEDLKKIKAQVETKVPTKGQLNVHPGFGAGAPMVQLLRDLVSKHLTNERLAVISFMGIENPEPWIFFPFRKEADGTFAVGEVRGGFSSPTNAQAFGFRVGDGLVHPVPTLNPQTGEGLSTAILFQDDIAQRLDTPLLPGATQPALKALKISDLADRVANPVLHNNFNTDCISCHTETTRSQELKLGSAAAGVAFVVPDGITAGVHKEVLPFLEGTNDSWNVRNFGWGLNFFKQRKPGQRFQATATRRTANEAAESAAFINNEYITKNRGAAMAEAGAPGAPGGAVHEELGRSRSTSTPLTLVMEINGEEGFQALTKLFADMEKLPDDRNPVRVSLNGLGLVHNARFVFIGKEKLAVITTFDGSMRDYISAFTDEISGVFNAILQHIKDKPALPVEDNEDEFFNYVKSHNLKSLSFYAAYPDLSVQEILSLRNNQKGKDAEAPK